MQIKEMHRHSAHICPAIRILFCFKSPKYFRLKRIAIGHLIVNVQCNFGEKIGLNGVNVRPNKFSCRYEGMYDM